MQAAQLDEIRDQSEIRAGQKLPGRQYLRMHAISSPFMFIHKYRGLYTASSIFHAITAQATRLDPGGFSRKPSASAGAAKSTGLQRLSQGGSIFLLHAPALFAI